MADAILREDAEKQGYIKNKYGFGKYAKEHGILTKHDIASIRIHERMGDMGTTPGGIGNEAEDED